MEDNQDSISLIKMEMFSIITALNETIYHLLQMVYIIFSWYAENKVADTMDNILVEMDHTLIFFILMIKRIKETLNKKNPRL
jgi:hypothetical protein